MPTTIRTLTLADARRIIAAGEAKAEALETPYNLAVVDAGGNLVAHVRMDGAWLGSIDIAIHKAWTARAFDMPTEDLAKMAQSGKPLFGINTTNHDKVVVFGGGGPGQGGGPGGGGRGGRERRDGRSGRRGGRGGDTGFLGGLDGSRKLARVFDLRRGAESR